VKHVEQKIYEAFRAGSGVRLTDSDVMDLMDDDAMRIRVSNWAAHVAGYEQPCEDMIGNGTKTWRQLGEWNEDAKM